VLLGGYILGRTKKGGMAVRLATQMAMKGQGQPGELVRQNTTKLLQSDQTQQLIAQLREQFTAAVQQAIDARATQISERLNERTEAITSGADQGTKKVTETAGKVGDQATQQFEYGEDVDKETADESQDQVEDPAQGDEEGQERVSDGSADATSSESDESSESGGDELEERIVELKGLRITSLRKIAKKMFDESEGDKIDRAEKKDLAAWIAEAEKEDAEETEDESAPARSKAGAR